MAEEIKLGIYRHYKGSEYKVLQVAVNEETKEKMIIYQSLADEKIWVRPKKVFLEEVEVAGKKMPRFAFIKEDKNDLENKYKRALADYQNLLKQTAREKSDFACYANEQLLREILPVYDNLKLAIEHHNGESTDDLPDRQAGWLKGVEHVVKQFKDVLHKIGVEEIKVKDKKFDHNLMDAIGSEETDDESLDGLVAKQVKAGYRLNGKVIEPAKVIVYKLKNDK